MKYQQSTGTLAMVERQHRSFSNYNLFPLPLLSLHNQLHQSWNNWFPPFMLMLWIWSIEEQIFSCVVFWAWHLEGNKECVRFHSDSRMLLLWPQWQPWVKIPGCICPNQSRHWTRTRPSDVFHHCLFRDLCFSATTDGGKLDPTHACSA